MKWTPLLLAMLAGAAVPACAARDSAGKVMQFADWTAACDNAGRCEAISLSAGMQWRRGEGWLASPGEALLRVVRDGEMDAPARVYVDHRMAGHHQASEALLLRPIGAADANRAGPGLPLFPREHGLEELDPAAVAGFIADSATASEAEVRTAAAPFQRRARISTNGMIAALRAIDAAQGRANTSGAMVARGNRPAKARRWPSLPVIRPVPGEGGREASYRHAGSGYDADSGLMTVRTNVALPPGRSANFGNCGTIRTYAWSGRAFVLAQQQDMPACAGIAPANWLVTYRSSPPPP